MKKCTKCERELPLQRFGSKSWTNQDGSKTFTKKSHCRDCINQSNLERYHNNPQTKKAHRSASYRHRIKCYGITEDDYDRMLKEQGDKCKSCKEASERTLNIDHCHKTGKVRGLLCNNCNTALGHAKDDVERLKLLIRYLEENNE